MNKFFNNETKLYHIFSINLTFITETFKKNYQTIFLCLLLYGLSFSILLKEINLVLLKNYNLHFIVIYRFFIIFFSLYFFINMKKKINNFLIFYLLIVILFLYNSLNGQEFNFGVDPSIFYKSININYDDADIFFQNKNKILIICIFNILLPLIVFALCGNFKFDFEKFSNLSLIICNIYLYFLFAFLIYKFVMIKLDIIKLSEAFINIHSMIYILNIHFLIILNKIRNMSSKYNLINFFNLALIIFCFFLAETLLHLSLCFLTMITFIYFFDINKKYFFLFFIIFCVLIFLSLFKIAYFDFQNLDEYLDFRNPGNSINSLYVRIMNIKFFLLNTENFNYLIGNNIFIDKIYTYPHNIFVDIYITCGFLGLFIFSAWNNYIQRFI